MIFSDKKRRTLHWAEAFGASAVVHLGAAIMVFDLLPDRATPPEPEPEIEIISIVLEDDTAPVPEEPLTNDPLSETPEPDGSDTTEDTEPPDQPDEDDQDPAPDDPTEGLEPQIAEIADAAPQTLAPVAAETALAPRPVSPLRPEDGTAIPVAPQSTTTLSPQTGIVIAAAPITSLAPTETTSLQPRETLPSAPPPTTALAPTPDGPAAGGAVNELVTRIRARLADPCLLAIPQQGADGAPELVMLGSDEVGMQAFANAVLADLSPPPGQRSVLMDSRQCAALNFVRENRSYPAFRLSVSLDRASIESGTNLTGRVGNTAGRYISLLLVDANGVVQDIGTYLSFTGSAARFDVPMTRDGAARDTSQALIALATATRPGTLNTQNGQLADTFFAALRNELGPDTPLVLVPFDVR